MAGSILAGELLDRLMRKDRNEAEYQSYNFKEKYANKFPTTDDLVCEFNSKLVRVLDALGEKSTQDEQKQLIALYEERAKKFLDVASQPGYSSDKSRFFQREMLARSIQMLDDVLEGNDGLENNEQCLLLAHDLDRETESAVFAGVFKGFCVVGLVVGGIIAAAALNPACFLCLGLLLAVVEVDSGLTSALKSSASKKAMTSFSEVNEGFFPKGIEGGDVSQDDDLDNEEGLNKDNGKGGLSSGV